MRLVSSHEFLPFISPYSGKLLKPYIWRDLETVSPWSRLMNEIKSKQNEKTENSPLDYCYVRPQHIASINSLCEHFFWPGIDCGSDGFNFVFNRSQYLIRLIFLVSDTLLYPEFSCVALYKKIVVGFAFLVPDVSLNEAYISFVFTRPEWRKCGIASFMIYHLTQVVIWFEWKQTFLDTFCDGIVFFRLVSTKISLFMLELQILPFYYIRSLVLKWVYCFIVYHLNHILNLD